MPYLTPLHYCYHQLKDTASQDTAQKAMAREHAL
jgi:hypothetical protein